MTNETTELNNHDNVPDEYAYNEESAKRADDAASRISENGPYIGTFVKAQATESAKTGTKGIIFGFDSPGQGTCEFTLWTKKSDGTEVFGMSMVNAMMFFFGLKSLKSEKAKVKAWVDGEKGREEAEVDGRIFPELLGKNIGLVLQKELYSKQAGGDGQRISLYGLFQPESKLMMSEIKERKTVPVKLERLLKGLKTKDQRKHSDEPGQPSIGATLGDGY